MDRLDISGVDLDGHGLRQHLHGENKAKKILFAEQDALDPFHRSSLHAYSLSAAQEGMGFYVKIAFDRPADSLDLCFRNVRYLVSAAEYHMYSGSRKYL